jgi:hypothetical protein
MHMPVQVNVKKIKEFVSSFLVPITSNGVEKGGHGYITSDHWIHRPWIQQGNKKMFADEIQQTILYPKKLFQVENHERHHAHVLELQRSKRWPTFFLPEAGAR